jgi:hypothetical protein
MDVKLTIRALPKEASEREESCDYFGTSSYVCRGDVVYEVTFLNQPAELAGPRLMCLKHAEKVCEGRAELPKAIRTDGKITPLSVSEVRETERHQKDGGPGFCSGGVGASGYGKWQRGMSDCKETVLYEIEFKDGSTWLAGRVCLEHGRKFAEFFEIPLPPPDEIPGPRLVKSGAVS